MAVAEKHVVILSIDGQWLDQSVDFRLRIGKDVQDLQGSEAHAVILALVRAVASAEALIEPSLLDRLSFDDLQIEDVEESSA